ncbi:GNAT family N-acetyltransferase [Actinophytocola xanthii]|uniref:GNAT family N-acetyltransferase n=1 Tax=Actinophytocola xanthii TaxID=1912961 RepID=A0A1Q8CWL6_9PSEU|nr:GNAT family N-acetyltransferase [Actinophytocola xanthii]OLF18722.1 GNAT family N-acetyltransferase [Actinophytocola xanthii]
MRIDALPYDHPDSLALIEEVQQEYVVRYGSPDDTPVEPAQFAPPEGLFLVAYLDDGSPAACGGWRVHGADAVELKRMYVSPRARGRGLARAVLAELERRALAAGYGRVVLESGLRQPEALALYASAGYTAVPKFGYYAEAPESVHLGKVLDHEPTPAHAE